MLSLLAFRGQAQDDNPIVAPIKDPQQSSTLGVKAKSVAPLDASKMVSEQQAIILDVREDSEWNQQRIPGAIHISLAQLNSRLSELDHYKELPIIAQCRSGRRSQSAQKILMTAGFSKAYNLEGGLIAWRKAGLKSE